jgi:hypothetical protein
MLNILFTRPPPTLPVLVVVTTVTCVRDSPPATKENYVENKIQNTEVYMTR